MSSSIFTLKKARAMKRFFIFMFLSMIISLFPPNYHLWALNNITYPGESCKTSPLSGWSEQEKWVWNQLCVGKVAKIAEHYSGSNDPNNHIGWKIEQKLSPNFLKTILLYEPYRSALTSIGVNIDGAWFEKPVNLFHASINHKLSLFNSRFEQSVDLRNLRSNYSLSLIGSACNKSLKLGKAKLKSNLFLRNVKFRNINMAFAEIGDRLEISNSEVSGMILMTSIIVGENLFMKNCSNHDVILLNAEIKGQIDLTGSKSDGVFDMHAIKVGQHIIMENKGEYKKVDLGKAEINGQIIMNGSEFSEELQMSNIYVKEGIFMHGGSKFSNVILRGGKIEGQIVMTGSEFLGNLDMNHIKIGDSLIMSGGARFPTIDLIGAEINGQIQMNGSKFSGEINMYSVQAQKDLLMSDMISNAKVNLRSSTVGGRIAILGSKFSDDLEMDSIHVKLLKIQNSNFTNIKLHHAVIGEQIELIESKFFKVLNMDAIQVRGSFFIKDSDFKSEVFLTYANIKSNLVISNNNFSSLQLSGTNILGNLRFDQLKTNESWPNNLDLNGLRYNGIEDLNKRILSYSALRVFLTKQNKYSPQPYLHLAKVLKSNGQNLVADKILFLGKEHKRAFARVPNSLWLFFLKYTIGYGIGYRYFLALIWVAFFVRLGFGVLRWFGDDKNQCIKLGHAYSLDMLLPIIRLREKHYEIDLSERATLYFYFHKIIGYVLAFFIIAGLSGLAG